MTVPYSTPATLEFIGNNTANFFSITFPTFEEDNVEVAVADSTGLTTDLVKATDFTLDNIARANTNSSLTLVSAGQPWIQGGKLKTGYTLFIKFNPIAFQPARFRDLGRFSPETFEKSLDRLTMSILAVNDKANNAVSLQLGDGGDGVIPPLTGNGLKILQVKADASGFEYGISSDEILVARDAATTAASAAAASQANAITQAGSAATSAATALANKNLSETYKNQAASSASTSTTASLGASASETAANLSSAAATSSQNIATTKAAEAAASAADAAASALAAASATADATAAEIARDAAETFKNSSEAAAIASADSAADSLTAKVGSETARNVAQAFRDETENLKDQTEAAEQQAALWAGRGLYDKIVNVTFAMSPYTIDEDSNLNSIFIVNDAGGNVTLILPLIADTADHPNWKAGIVKASTSANQINITTVGGDTINTQVASSVNDPKIGMLLYANAPTDWKGLHFMNATVAADALPVGGIAGDILVKNSPTNSDATWRPDSSIINALIFG